MLAQNQVPGLVPDKLVLCPPASTCASLAMSAALVLVAVLLAPSCSAAPDRRRLSADGYYQFTALDDLGLPVLSFVSTSGGVQAVLPPGAATETPLAEGQVSSGAASGTAKPDGAVVDETVEGVPIGIPSASVGEGPVRDVVRPTARPAPVRDVLVEVPAGEVALVNITVVQIPAGGGAPGTGPVRDVLAGATPVIVSSPEGVPVEASVVGAPPPVAPPSGDVSPEGAPVEGSVAVVDPAVDEAPVEAVVVEGAPEGADPVGEQHPAGGPDGELPARGAGGQSSEEEDN
ncbi:calphotin-like [Penaeus chinensis]|uniref:calphotin-like n=1 Tax=Penaeus chinensis TaxID=139456 RepID=UPI001FB6FA23|nr:calphotin-like [Penaeus chinensis]